MKEESSKLIQFFIFILLFIITIVRLTNDKTYYLPYINYCSLLIVLITVFSKVCVRYDNHLNINKFKGFVCLFVTLPLGIISALIICGKITINNNWSDGLALFSLTIGVPTDTIFNGISKVFFNEPKKK